MFDATFVISVSAMVPLTRTTWVVLLCTAVLKAEALVTVTVLPLAPPVVAAPKPMGAAAAATAGSDGASVVPLAVVAPITAMTTALAAAAPVRVNRALVLRMWISVRGVVEK
ncbi:hypothetical protein GCM10017557_02220 [Streptomyces aurantiacus]|uniref:Uncharacterized protein n=1 Tax=Streptomyces aurantiacus TaxID=47760 RepID=A0A7G1NQ48_9ACTN|nr:hypothetical protein GCM10017557_02220 [Streptomyces aurantiacus]